MNNKLLNILVFLLSGAALLITIILFINMGYYVDEHQTSPDVVLGGEVYLSLDWLRLFLLKILVLASGLNLLKKS